MAGNAVKVDGQVLFNNTTLSSLGNKENVIAHVAQEDRLLPYLTVSETLKFAADLKLADAHSMSAENKDKLVRGVMAELGLLKVSNTIIGDRLQRGISGGEKRRTSVGFQLVTNPSILILDGGPFSFSAYATLLLLMIV